MCYHKQECGSLWILRAGAPERERGVESSCAGWTEADRGADDDGGNGGDGSGDGGGGHDGLGARLPRRPRGSAPTWIETA